MTDGVYITGGYLIPPIDLEDHPLCFHAGCAEERHAEESPFCVDHLAEIYAKAFAARYRRSMSWPETDPKEETTT